MHSEARSLKDVGTGRTAVQGETDGIRVTVFTEPHPLRSEVTGRGFVLVSPAEAFVDDEEWEQILGSMVALPGGTLLNVRDVALGQALEGADPSDPLPDLLVPLTIRDIYLPPADVLIPLARLRSKANLVGPDDGPRANGPRTPCEHPSTEFPHLDCLFCFWRWWASRAKALGLTHQNGGWR